MYPVTLAGRVVTLREFRSDDAADSLAIVGDDQVTHWLSFDSRDLDAAQAIIDGAVHRAQVEPRSEYYLAVTDPDDELVGFARACAHRREGSEARLRPPCGPMGQGICQRRHPTHDLIRL
jgi:Acetyltransferase (GNAT) domain